MESQNTRLFEDVKTLLPFMTPFPAAEQVFCGDVAEHAKHLLPLLTIELSALNPRWSGKLHFINPKEPYEGLIGERTADYHDYYNRENWLAFKVENERYRFLGDFRYFYLEGREDADLAEHYLEAEQGLEKAKAFYQKYGILNPWGQTDNPQEWVNDLGGKPDANNWSVCDFPLAFEPPGQDYGDYAYPLTEDGRRFHYIGSVTGYSYCDAGADAILLFYDPQESIALFTFDWS